MKINTRAATVLSTIAIVLTLASAGLAQSGDGYAPIAKTHAGAGLAADFAVMEKSKTMKPGYTLADIAKAEIKEGKGSKMGSANFRLCLKVDSNRVSSFASTVVSMDQYSNLKLVSWEASTCGGDSYKPVEKTHAGAGLAADVAVKEQSKRTKTPLKLVSMVKAEVLERAGEKLGSANFRLCLITSGKGSSPSSQAIVSMDQYSNFKLISWTDSKCAETDGEFEQVENTHPGLGLAADFAVKDHSKTTKIDHKLVGILKGEIKGMFSPTYRVCMRVGEGRETQVVQATVTMDQYSNMKLIKWEHSTCGK